MKVLYLCTAIPTQENYGPSVKKYIKQTVGWQEREDCILMVSLYQCDICACMRALVCMHLYLL